MHDTSSFSSGQGFIRALKAASDPPQPGGPLKIEIARTVWDKSDIQIQNKAQIIYDWILNKFLKDREPGGSNNPVIDLRYWSLLSDTITYTAGQSSSNVKSRLYSLLNQTPLAPIVTLFLSLTSLHSHPNIVELFQYARNCFDVLWPLAVPKFTAEVLLACWIALVASFHHNRKQIEADANFAKIAFMICDSYRYSLSNSSNKKKLYQTFVNSHLPTWLEIIRDSHSSPSKSPLVSVIHVAGAETLFNLDMLRHLTSLTSLSSDPLFSKLSGFMNQSPEAVTADFPGLFLSYVQNIKRHRSEIFGSGPSGQGNVGLAGQIQNAGMRFFTACDKILRTCPEHLPFLWTARVHMLEVVEQEELFRSQVQSFDSSTQQDEEAGLVLQRIFSDAIDLLESALGNQHTTGLFILKLAMATQSMAPLVRIDYELVSSSTPRLLRSLLIIPYLERLQDYLSEKKQLEQHVDAFLSLILSHHSKTRTIPSYLEILLGSLKNLTLPRISSGGSGMPQLLHRACYESRLMSQGHLGQLSKCCHVYVTPLQVTEIVESVCQTLGDTFRALNHRAASNLYSGDGIKPKKRKGSQEVDSPAMSGREAELAAIRFTVAANVAGVVLPFLPFHSLTANNRKGIISKVWTGVTRDIATPALRMYISPFATSADGSTKKRKTGVIQREPWMVWVAQIVGAAVLRLSYSVAAAPQYGFNEPISCLDNEMEEEVGMKDILFEVLRKSIESETGCRAPELIIEAIRNLFKSRLSSQSQDKLFEIILDYLEKYLKTSVDWDGTSSALNSSEVYDQAAVALLHNLADRWLGAFERLATASQLTRLAEILINVAAITPRTKESNKLCAHDILVRMLRSGEFWELPRLRAELFGRIDMITAPYDDLNLPDLLLQIRHDGAIEQNTRSERLQQALSVYTFLSYVPQEYMHRQNRIELLDRATVLDVLAMLSRERKTCISASRRQMDILSIRTFLVRTSSYLGLVEHEALAEMAEYLLKTHTHLDSEISNATSDEKGTEMYGSVTITVLKIYITTMLKMVENGVDGPLLQFLPIALQYSSFSTSQNCREMNKIAQQSILILIDDLTSDFTIASFSSETQAYFKTLHQSLLSVVTHKLKPQNLEGISSEEHFTSLEAWPRVLRLGCWLQSDAVVLPLGPGLIFKLLPYHLKTGGRELQRFCLLILSVLLEEYRCIAKIDRLAHAELATTFYLSTIRTLTLGGDEDLDVSMCLFSRALSVPDFTHALDLIYEALGGSGSSPSDLECLVHLSTMFLGNAPEGTLRVTQNSMTGCLNMFTQNDVFHCGSPSLRLAVLTFLSRHFSERPAAVRTQDVNNVWSLLSKLLGGCENHDEATDETVFQHILSILSALIRLRRDLLLSTLPHLGFVLQQLIKATRIIRPHLGAKQTKIVTGTLPMWINAADPLPLESSKALGRLITSLGTKTVVRTHGALAEPQKAESLAKPFSKHAAYVLQAYIEAMNDPLCVMPSEVRRELYPGLFTLCDMMNDHNRDAMMVSSLDAGGKATMKALWKEYEKQKYVGKG